MNRRQFIALSTIGTVAGCNGSTATTLNGQGSTFIEPIMKGWTNAYLDHTADRIRVNYQGTGSGAGLSQMMRRTVEFGCSDVPMSLRQRLEAEKQGGMVVHIPLVMGAVVPVYNLPGLNEPLAFTGPVLAELFTGRITQWNDWRIKAANPNINLPNKAVQPVFRADPSGTSFLFADYLAKVKPSFKGEVGVSTTPNWPLSVGIKQNKSDGVAGYIARTPGAIGYLELTFALDTKATFGHMVNQAGQTVPGSLAGIEAAASASVIGGVKEEPFLHDELTVNLNNMPGDASYPIVGTSYAVLYSRQGTSRGHATVDFLRWVMSPEAQAMARRRNFGPLPEVIRTLAVKVLDKLGRAV